MRNILNPHLVSSDMETNHVRIVVTLVMCCAVLLTGCNKKSGDTAGAAKDSPITGKPSDAPVAVQPAWKVDHRYVMRLERVQTSSFPGGGRRGRAPGATNNAPFETIYAQEYSVVVTNAADVRGAELEILGIELQVGQGEQQWVNYDSQNKVAPRDPNNPVPDLLDKLIGGKIRYAFDADNKVTKVEGLKELFDRMETQTLNGGAGRRGAGLMGGMLRQSMTDDVFKQMVDLSGAPSSAVKIGDSWPLQKEVNAPMIGKLTVYLTNTLRGWQVHEGNKCARVEFAGTIATSGGPTQAGPMGGRIVIQEAVVKGHYWHDPAINMTRELFSVQDYKVIVSGLQGRGNTNNATPQTITAPIHETTSVKVLEVKPADKG